MDKKTGRTVVCTTPTEKLDIEQWAACEGRTASNFLFQLFVDYKRRAKSEGLPMPVDADLSDIAEAAKGGR